MSERERRSGAGSPSGEDSEYMLISPTPRAIYLFLKEIAKSDAEIELAVVEVPPDTGDGSTRSTLSVEMRWEEPSPER